MDRSTLVRRGAPLAVFAAVLAGLLALNAGGGPGSRTLDPIPLSGFGAGGGSNETASDSAARSSYYGGAIVIPDRLLVGLPTEGPVHKVTTGQVTDERLLELAAALGVVGTVRGDAEGWTVGEGDRVLRVWRTAGAPWHLGPDKAAIARDGGTVVAEPVPSASGDGDTPVSSDEQPATPAECKPGEKCEVPSAPATCPPPPDGTEPACAPVDPVPMPEPTKPPQPTDAEARATAQRVFDAAGLVDPTITLNDGWSGKEVVASPVVGGLQTLGMETRVLVEIGGRIAYANGHLGGVAFKDTYPVLDPREAVERGGAWGPRTMTADAIGAPCPPEEPCPTPEPREATALRLGLVFMGAYDGNADAYLAPAWLLKFKDSTWEEPVLALPDQYVATPPPATGQTDPGAPPPDGATDGGGTDGSTGTGSTGSVGSTGAPDGS